MWLSDGGPVAAQELIFEFDQAYDLAQIAIWQFNQSHAVNTDGDRGVSTFTLHISADNINYTQIGDVRSLTLEDGSNSAIGAQIQDLVADNVRYVKLDILTNGGDDFVGLSEVRFLKQDPNGQFTEDESALYYVHNDHLGTSKILTDNNQNVVWQAMHTPFGLAIIETEILESNLRFPGQYFDRETGYHYNWWRYYDPSTGRYLRVDPLGLFDGPNPYLYAQANPLKYVDPDGRAAILVILPFLGGSAATTTAGGLGFWGLGALLGGAVLMASIPGDTPRDDVSDDPKQCTENNGGDDCKKS